MLASIKTAFSNLKLPKQAIVFFILSFSTVGIGTAIAEFKTHPTNPVFDIGPTGAWDSMYVEAGPITFHDDKYHMFYTGLPKWPDNIAIGYAWSTDGIKWQRGAKAPILTIDDTPYEDQSITSDSIVVTDEGKWMLYYGIGEQKENFDGRIGLATAASPTGPWTVHPEPVLSPGPEGSWDANKVGHPDIFSSDDGFVMYYTGYGDEKVGGFDEEHGHIGLATSSDGINWTKHNDPSTANLLFADSDPVLSRSSGSSWDNWHVKDANVRRVDGRWKMLYQGVTSSTSGNFGFAISDDGVNWTRSQGNPVIDAKKTGQVLFFATYIRHENEDRIYIEGGTNSTTKVYLYVNSN